jgi:hypothetical protein
MRTYDLFVLCDIDIPRERDEIRLGATRVARCTSDSWRCSLRSATSRGLLASGTVEQRMDAVDAKLDELGLLTPSVDVRPGPLRRSAMNVNPDAAEQVAAREEIVARLSSFLAGIGIDVVLAPVEGDTFLPGICIDRGRLLVDPDRLLYPGDLLHEAGHIAVMVPERRAEETGNANAGGMGDEIGAILWSFAAAQAAGVADEVVFHGNGYRGNSEWFIEQFRGHRNYIGLPLLEWMGLTLGPEPAAEQGVDPFPHMVRWLRSDAPPELTEP